MLSMADQRIAKGLRPRTFQAYKTAFRLYVAFMVFMGLHTPYDLKNVVIFLEFLAQKDLRAPSLRNYLSVLKHYFGLFGWPTMALSSRKVLLMVKSVHMNARLKIRVKSVFTIPMLEKLIKFVTKCTNGTSFKAVFLTAFFGFFRLASLVPNSVQSFDKTRYLTYGDLIFGPPGIHLVMTCAKNMQQSGAYQVVQLPKLKNSLICPVNALKNMVKSFKYDKDTPLFNIHTKKGQMVITAPKVRSFLKMAIVALGLNPSQYTFHAFRRSEASMAFDSNVEFEKIKQHGNWQSEAIWRYLNSTPKAASPVPYTFQQLLDKQ